MSGGDVGVEPVVTLPGTGFGPARGLKRLRSGRPGSWHGKAGVALLDLDGGFLESNATYGALLGCRAAELRGQKISQHLHPADRATFRNGIGRLRRGRLPAVEMELRYLTAGGNPMEAHTTVHLARDPAGRPLHLVALVTEDTANLRAAKKLRESEARLRLSARAANVGLWDWDLRTNKVFFSPEWKRQIGYRDEEIANRFEEWRSRVHPEDRKATLERIRAYLAHPRGQHESEFRFRHKDGSYRWIHTQADVLRDGQGKPVRMLGCHIDITERKAAEEQVAWDLQAVTRLQRLNDLFMQEGKLGAMLEAILDAAIAIANADFGTIQLLDPVTGDLRIMTQRGFPRWWLDFWNRTTRGKATCRTAMERGRRVIVEDVEQSPVFANRPALAIQRRAGVRAVQSTPLISRSGKLVGMFSTHFKRTGRPADRVLRLLDLLGRQAADLIEHLQMESALRESEGRFRALVQASSDVVYRMSADWSEMRELVGRDFIADTDTPNRTWLERYIHPDDQSEVVAVIQRAVREKSVFESEHRVRRVDGSLGWTFSRAVPMLDPKGRIIEWFGCASDITERKRLEQQLLEVGEREQRRIGHDLHDGLCQELNGICYLAKLLEREMERELPGRAGEAERLGKLLAHALQVTRKVARGLQPVPPVPEGLMLTLRELADRTRDLYGVECRFECRKPVLVRQHSTATHLYRMAQEAVSNALKHGHPTRIRVRLAPRSEGILLGVRDNGVGIRRRHRSARGMGLHILQYRAEAIRGTLVVRRRPEGGTEVVCIVASQELSPPEDQNHATQTIT